MTQRFFSVLFVFVISLPSVIAQDEVNPRPITMQEYQKALTFEVGDLDKDTYVKFENAYILDRYELKKPVFITGDDGLRKRVDLYKLIARDGLQELGVMVFYTNEKGDLYKALVPNYTASGEVWEEYFEHIHSIDKEEENFVLKLSYVLSREFSFQIFKGINEGEIAEEDGTYGSDICFPGDQLVSLSNGASKFLKDIVPGDDVLSINPATQKSQVIKVSKLVAHQPERYAITVLTLIKAERHDSGDAIGISFSQKQLKATPNHPMLTDSGHKQIGEIQPGERVLSWDNRHKTYQYFEVFDVKEVTEGKQPVYSIEGEAGQTLIMNGVMVKQKN